MVVSVQRNCAGPIRVLCTSTGTVVSRGGTPKKCRIQHTGARTPVVEKTLECYNYRVPILIFPVISQVGKIRVHVQPSIVLVLPVVQLYVYIRLS